MVIGCDGHILDPPGLWEKYLEARYKSRERTIPAMMPLIGEDKFFWASDNPHPDHPGTCLEELREMVAPMPDSTGQAILGGNVARACRLG